MSTLKVDAIVDSSAGNTTTINGTTPTAYNTMGKNRIINGAMEIDQRNAGASVALSGTGQFIVDRWKCRLDASSSSTGQQVSDAPSGFNNSIKITIGTGASPSSSQIGWLSQFTEGLYISDFGFGTADAKTVTLSFWVKSSVTGVFSGVIKNQNTSAYPFEYTVSSANTWEQKSVTIAGDTANTWGTDNSFGIGVFFDLGTGTTYQASDGSWASGQYFSATGSTSLCATSGATFYITGVQLEAGSVATEFERRPYGMELALCQRYYEKSYNIGTVPGTNTTTGIAGYIVMANSTTSLANNGTNAVVFKVYKRTTPTITTYDSVGNSGKLSYAPAGIGRQDNITSGVHRQAEGGFGVYTTSASSLTAGQAVEQFHQWTADAEL